MSFNIKILTTKALIISALLFSFSPAFAQYKLELEWEKNFGNGYGIGSVTKSDNDSLIYISANDTSITTISGSDGRIIARKPTPIIYGKIIMSRDGKTLTASNNDNSFIGILDPTTFEVTSSFTFGNLWNHSYNKVQNKIVACGNSNTRIYDVLAKKMTKEFPPSYFLSDETYIKDAKITDDGKYILYSFEKLVKEGSNWIYKKYLKMIDLDGNLVKDFGEVGSSIFGFTVDGKQLIYTTENTANFFDLEQIMISESIKIPTGDIGVLEISNNGKFILVGGAVVSYIDLEKKISYSTGLNAGSDMNFNLNFTNISLYSGSGKYFQKYNLNPTNSVTDNQNKLDIQIQVVSNDLYLSSKASLPPNIQLKITTYDGKINKVILPNEMDLNSNNVKINIADLTSGVYYIQVSDDKEIIFTSKFIKVE